MIPKTWVPYISVLFVAIIGSATIERGGTVSDFAATCLIWGSGMLYGIWLVKRGFV